ncbi:Alpha-L-rhamnosidase N-terminal domain-containing protein [Paenibacillaceae bacterium GAS479]|nr:Alpha-L-rhamnosidase N-terminal domain-containing protein [Paenibacillaceae bacterium GAS479]
MKSVTFPRFEAAKDYSERIVWSNSTKIIWHPKDVETHFEQPKNAFCYFRKTFDASEGLEEARIRIFADSKYQLFVNGEYAGRGPGRSDPRWQYVDEIDITSFIQSGKNIIAVHALHYGYGTGQSIHRIPALVVEANLAFASGEHSVISSDESWRCKHADAYDSAAPRINGCQGPIEVYDSRLALSGWEGLEYNDSDWQNAKGRGIQLSPFWNWIPRSIPLLEEGKKNAVAIAARGELAEHSRPVDKLHHQILAEQSSMEMSITAEPFRDEVVLETSPEGRASVITFDMGGMDAGYLQLRVSGSEGDVVDVVYAEQLWKGKALINLSNNRSIDRFILAGGVQELESAFVWRACRFIQLTVRNSSGPVTIERVGLRTRRSPLTTVADFHCNDDKLRQIWDISVHTLRLCMQDGFLDSSSREQQQWMGDGRWQAIFNYHYSGESSMHRKLLEQIGQSQDWMGMTKARYPDGHHNYPPIPSFCLAWVSSFGEYELYSEDRSLLPQWWPNLMQALRWFSAYTNEDGLLENVPYWPFIDWGEGPEGPIPDDQRGGVVTALNIQYVEALEAAARYARRLNDQEAETYYTKIASRLKESIVSLLWNDRVGAYADCMVDGVLSDSISEPTNALAVLLLHGDGERLQQISKGVFSQAASGSVIKGSPYFMLVVCRALIKLGETRRALELIRERYGIFLDAGSDTLWERWTLFHEEANGSVSYSSASHAWGGAPIVFVYEGIFGIKPLENGYRSFSMNPEPCGIESINTTLPVSGGEIGMSLENIDAGSWQLEVSIPSGYKGLIYGKAYEAGKHTLTISS